MSALGRAHTTLCWAAFLVTIAGLLVERARADVDRARDELCDERAARHDAEDEAATLRTRLDEAMDRFNAAKADGG